MAGGRHGHLTVQGTGERRGVGTAYRAGQRDPPPTVSSQSGERPSHTPLFHPTSDTVASTTGSTVGPIGCNRPEVATHTPPLFHIKQCHPKGPHTPHHFIPDTPSQGTPTPTFSYQSFFSGDPRPSLCRRSYALSSVHHPHFFISDSHSQGILPHPHFFIPDDVSRGIPPPLFRPNQKESTLVWVSPSSSVSVLNVSISSSGRRFSPGPVGSESRSVWITIW